MKTLAAAAALGTLLAGAVTGTSPAQSADACHGLMVTLTGAPGQPLVGSDGPDVIASNGATVVVAGAGNDTICATGDSKVDAGPGDDLLDTSVQERSVARLGDGADRYVGGPGFDDVQAAGALDPGLGPIDDHDVDIIDAGDGGGPISSGVSGAPNRDEITLGGGNSKVVYLGYQAGGFVDLGTGNKRVYVDVSGSPARNWVIGNGAEAGSSGSPLVAWTGFAAGLEVRGPMPDGASLTVLGNGVGEDIDLRQLHGPVAVRPRGGADSVVADCSSVNQHATLNAGPGHDALKVKNCPAFAGLDIDLDDHRLVVAGKNAKAAQVRGWEVVTLWAYRVVARGNEGPNYLEARGCALWLDGRAGADVLRLAAPSGLGCPGRTTLAGGPGNDRLVGSDDGNVLVGGPGRDVADGRAGVDTCLAEVTRRCERS